MLSQIYFGVPLWVWLIISLIIIVGYNNCSNLTKTEKFSNITPPNVTITNFNTEWCGWSKRFQPEWEEFSKSNELKQKTNITVRDIKCDDPNNDIICNNITGFPTVVVKIDGKRTLYDGGRTSNDLIEFIKNL
jgi:thiol-disulfide isomerase/thioredoxin